MIKISALGYTLIELLLVLSITSIIGIIGYVNYKDFSSDQIVIKAVSDVQSVLRLAQSNATSSTLCSNGQYIGPWSLVFNQTSIYLTCGLANQVQKIYNLENAQINSILGSSCLEENSSLPFTVQYSNLDGGLDFPSAGSDTCKGSLSWTFTLTNTIDTSKLKSFTISRGGAIDVEQ